MDQNFLNLEGNIIEADTNKQIDINFFNKNSEKSFELKRENLPEFKIDLYKYLIQDKQTIITPKVLKNYQQKFNLVLDLDNTLIKASSKQAELHPDVSVRLNSGLQNQKIFFRPNVFKFLKSVSKIAHLQIFSSGIQIQVSEIVAQLCHEQKKMFGEELRFKEIQGLTEEENIKAASDKNQKKQISKIGVEKNQVILDDRDDVWNMTTEGVQIKSLYYNDTPKSDNPHVTTDSNEINDQLRKIMKIFTISVQNQVRTSMKYLEEGKKLSKFYIGQTIKQNQLLFFNRVDVTADSMIPNFDSKFLDFGINMKKINELRDSTKPIMFISSVFSRDVESIKSQCFNRNVLNQIIVDYGTFDLFKFYTLHDWSIFKQHIIFESNETIREDFQNIITFMNNQIDYAIV